MSKERDKKKTTKFQFTALQKRIKLLNAKILLLTEENRRLKAEAREEWRHEASQESVPASEYAPPAPGFADEVFERLRDEVKAEKERHSQELKAKEAAKKPWWKLF